MNTPEGGPQPTPPSSSEGQPTAPYYPTPAPLDGYAPPYGSQASPTPNGAYSAPPRREISRQTLIIGGIILVALIAAGVVLALTGELGSFFTIGVVFIPLAALAAFSYGAVKNPSNVALAFFAYIMLGIVVWGLFFNTLTYILLGFVRDSAGFNQLLSQPGSIDSSTLSEIFDPNAGIGLLVGTLLLLLCVLLSAIMLLKPARVAVSRIMPIDPNNFVHKIALSALTMILFSDFIPLIVLGGKPPLLSVVNNSGSGPTSQALSAGPEDLIYQFVWTIPVALIAAGWPIVRRIRPALERLGFVRPTLAQVGFGVGAGLVLAVVASYVIDPGINRLWQTLGWSTTDTAAFDQLLANLITPFGAILIGVTAGIGEEMAVRGLLQPRIGLIASNLVFTSLHAFQYGLDGLLSVFIIGLILGIIRALTNTSTSAIVHGIYDFTLVFWSVIVSG